MIVELRHEIRSRRESLGLSRTDVARRMLALGGITDPDGAAVVSARERWKRWEEGTVRIPANAMPSIAAVLRTTVATLYRERPDPDEVARIVAEAIRGGAPPAAA